MLKLKCHILTISLILLTCTLSLAQHIDDWILPEDAELQELALITNTKDPNSAHLFLVLSANGIPEGIFIKDSDHNEDSDSPNGQLRRSFSLEEFQSDRGVVLARAKGFDVLKAKGEIDVENGDGLITLKYLKNAIFGSRKKCNIGLFRNDLDQWQLINVHDNTVVSEIRVKIGSLGIKTLINVCKPQKLI